jgi:outer membrane protein OmpA-like peptidoglycan-associated protein
MAGPAGPAGAPGLAGVSGQPGLAGGPGTQGAPARWESFKDILFDFDRSVVRTDEQATVQQIVQFMKEHPTFEVGLEGYTDPRGTNTYNQALSERRVTAIRDAVVAAGGAKNGIRIGAEGEKHRNCGEDTEGCFQKNRRVEVFVRPDSRAGTR